MQHRNKNGTVFCILSCLLALSQSKQRPRGLENRLATSATRHLRNRPGPFVALCACTVLIPNSSSVDVGAVRSRPNISTKITVEGGLVLGTASYGCQNVPLVSEWLQLSRALSRCQMKITNDLAQNPEETILNSAVANEWLVTACRCTAGMVLERCLSIAPSSIGLPIGTSSGIQLQAIVQLKPLIGFQRGLGCPIQRRQQQWGRKK